MDRPHSRQSRHQKLYAQAKQLQVRKDYSANSGRLSRVQQELAECSFSPTINRFLPHVPIHDSPRGVPKVVHRLTRGRQLHEQRVRCMMPREPIQCNYHDRSDHMRDTLPLRKQAVIEVTRNSSTELGEVEIVGRFPISSDSDPIRLAERFAAQYGLNSEQRMRLKQKLLVSINHL